MPYLDSANYELPYQSGSDTSEDAALRAKHFVGPQGLEVLWWFEQRGEYGGTQKEAAAGLNIGRPSICVRRHPSSASFGLLLASFAFSSKILRGLSISLACQLARIYHHLTGTDATHAEGREQP